MKKQKKILKQENCGEGFKIRKSNVYICNKCTMSSGKQWYHDALSTALHYH